jgi:hypothetical protein
MTQNGLPAAQAPDGSLAPALATLNGLAGDVPAGNGGPVPDAGAAVLRPFPGRRRRGGGQDRLLDAAARLVAEAAESASCARGTSGRSGCGWLPGSPARASPTSCSSPRNAPMRPWSLDTGGGWRWDGTSARASPASRSSRSPRRPLARIALALRAAGRGGRALAGIALGGRSPGTCGT